jgi:hypothetical protein
MDRSKQSHQEHDADSQLLNQQEALSQGFEHRLADPAAAQQRTRSTPPGSPNPADIKTLQKTVGNRAVQRLLAGRSEASKPVEGAVQRHMLDSDFGRGMSASRNVIDKSQTVMTTGDYLKKTGQWLQTAGGSMLTNGISRLHSGFDTQQSLINADMHPCEREEGGGGGV